MSKTFKVLVPAFLVLAYAIPTYAVPKITDIPPLIKKLKDGDSKARAAAAKEIGAIGLIKLSYVKPAIPALLVAAKDKDDEVRMAALAALGITKADPEEAVPVFMNALQSDNERLKIAAMEGLRYYGAGAKAALPELQKIDAEIKRLGKEEQKAKRNLARAVQDTIRAITGRR